MTILARILELERYVDEEIDNQRLLQRVERFFRIIDFEARPVSQIVFQHQDSLQYEISGKFHRKNLVLNGGCQNRVARMFRGKQGNQYIFPDFNNIFPAQITE